MGAQNKTAIHKSTIAPHSVVETILGCPLNMANVF